MALVLVGKGCSKCRWASTGCGACDPDTPRSKRGPRGGKSKAKAVPVKKTTKTKAKATSRVLTKSAKGLNVKFPSKSKAKAFVDINSVAPKIVTELTLVPVLTADGRRGRGRPRVLRPPRTELGCSKCRYAAKGCGKCREELKEAKLLLGHKN